MNKIFFLIPLFMIGCSTPEIHIPSYDFSSDTSSTENENKAEEATSVVSKQEADYSSEEDTNNTNFIEMIEAKDIQSETEIEKEEIIEEESIEKKELNIIVEESDNLPITQPKKKPKNNTNINKSKGFFASLFKDKPKVKNEYYTGGKIRSKLIMSDSTGESGLLYKYGYESQITSTVHIKHGIKNGLETLFNKKGQVAKRTPYVNGRKDGIVEVYYPDGKVLAQITYADNKRHGRASKYNHDGTTNEEVQYNRGRIISQQDDIDIPIID